MLHYSLIQLVKIIGSNCLEDVGEWEILPERALYRLYADLLVGLDVGSWPSVEHCQSIQDIL